MYLYKKYLSFSACGFLTKPPSRVECYGLRHFTNHREKKCIFWLKNGEIDQPCSSSGQGESDSDTAN